MPSEHVRPGGYGNPLGIARITEQVGQPAGEIVDIPRAGEQPGHTVRDDLWDAGCRECDHRCSACLRFQNAQRQAFQTGREHQRVACPQQTGYIRAWAEEAYPHAQQAGAELA